LRNDNREIFRAARDAQGIAELILDRHPTWRLQDGVCVARTEPGLDDEADAHRQRVIEAPTATDDPAARPDVAPPPPLAAPYRWAFAAVRDSDAIPEDSPLGRLSRRVDDALPLSTPLRAAAVPAPTPALSRRPDGSPTVACP